MKKGVPIEVFSIHPANNRHGGWSRRTPTATPELNYLKVEVELEFMALIRGGRIIKVPLGCRR